MHANYALKRVLGGTRVPVLATVILLVMFKLFGIIIIIHICSNLSLGETN